MLLKFIGKDGSMGLHHGELYDVKVYTRQNYICVMWMTDRGYVTNCPYDSPQALAANWEVSR